MFRFSLIIVLVLHNILAGTYYFDETKLKEIKGELNESLFGYALATHQVDETSISLLVGSPGLNGGKGAVFECHSDFSKSCNNMLSPRSSGIRWLGATVVTRNGIIMICAPRSVLNEKVPQSEGECFYRMQNESDFKPVPAPLMNSKDFESRYTGVDIRTLTFHRGLCLTGIAATIITDLHSPAQFVSSSPSCANYKNELPNSFSTGIWIADAYSTDATLYRPNDYSMYFGYALAVGVYFNSHENCQFLAVSIGSHFYSDFAGRVNIYDTKNLRKEIAHFIGLQPGEYFGASIATVDLNGDKLDDIVIGAPFYTNFTNSEVKHDLGAVYVFLQLKLTRPPNSANNQLFKFHKKLFGKTISGRFGFAVAGIGDIDGDGYNELAVGAPYENEEAGSVYIYHGYKGGIRKEPGEIIRAKDFNSSVQTFGSAITSGDFDKNGFNDIVVGAPVSNVAIYLPARPVINVILRDFVFYPAKVMVTNGKCLPNNEECTKLKYCITYTSVLPIKEKISLLIKFALDPVAALIVGGTPSHRLEFAHNNKPNLTHTVTLTAQEERCREETIIFTTKKQYRGAPIKAQITLAVQPLMKDEKLVPVVNASSVRHESSILKVEYVRAEKSISDLSWWVYLLCALGALTIISAIIGALKRLGFFKRTMPQNGNSSISDKKSTITKSPNEEQL